MTYFSAHCAQCFILVYLTANLNLNYGHIFSPHVLELLTDVGSPTEILDFQKHHFVPMHPRECKLAVDISGRTHLSGDGQT